MMLKKTFGVFAILAAGCFVGVESDEFEQQGLDDTTLEIVKNLEDAGFPEEEIGVLEDGTVYVGMDAVVTLEASRELAGMTGEPGEPGADAFRQYRTNNTVSASIGTICIDGGAFNGAISDALNASIANYNAEGLSFTMVRNDSPGAGCDAVITGNQQGGSGGSAGFPSGGLPYDTINIGTGIANYGQAVLTHVITHELGHCVGFRHTDYFNRSISCGGSPSDEGSGGIGAVHIPGTPTGAQLNGSVMNSCYNLDSTGSWTNSDQTALAEMYGGGGGGGDGGGGPVCGDGVCEGGETCGSCEDDCGACPVCEPKGASCSSDAECCSNRCRGGGSKTCK